MQGERKACHKVQDSFIIRLFGKQGTHSLLQGEGTEFAAKVERRQEKEKFKIGKHRRLFASRRKSAQIEGEKGIIWRDFTDRA